MVSGRPSGSIPPPDDRRAATREFWSARAAALLGQGDHALEHVERSLTIDPRFSGRWTFHAELCRSSGRFDDARRSYGRALELEPDDLEALSWFGALHLLDDAELATSDDPRQLALDRATADDTTDPAVAFWMAVATEADDDVDRAREWYRRAVDLDPTNTGRRRRFAEFEAATGRYESADVLMRDLEDSESTTEVPPWVKSPYSPLSDESQDTTGWAAAIVRLRAVLHNDPDDVTALRGLGTAGLAVGDWDLAVDALERLATLDPTDPTVFDSLGRVRSTLGDPSAVSARQQAVVLRPTAARYHQLALELARAGRHGESAAAHAMSAHLSGTRADWIDQFGRVRRQAGALAEAVATYRRALERFPDLGQLWFQLGFALERLGDDDAIAAYEQAIKLEPANTEWLFRLGFVFERFGAERTVAVSRIGLMRRTTGDLERATICYRRILAREPDNIRTLMRLGAVEERRGDLTEAQRAYGRATELEPDNPSTHHLLGRAIAAEANQRGIYHADEHDRIETLWSRAIELAPHRDGSRQQLVRASVKAARWGVASEAAWHPAPPRTNSAHRVLREYLESEPCADRLAAAREVLEGPTEPLMSIPMEWWFPLHWRLLADNEFALGYQAKRHMASRIVDDLHGSLGSDLAGYLERARALTVLGRRDEALELVTPSLVRRFDCDVRLTLGRHAADIHLRNGDVGPHIEALDVHRSANLAHAEEHFSSLIAGKRIAIVGPGLSDIHHGPEIDDHDIVIRTKFVADQLEEHAHYAGSRTDISYYALGSARFLKQDIHGALAAGDLKMAVFRTSTFTESPAFLERPGDVRYVPSEYQMSMRASQFAIQRIIYDTIRYQPTSIKVYNIDFFLAPDAYRPGYVVDYHRDHIERGFIQVLNSFGHDFLADFLFTRAMYRHGLVQVDDRITEILRLDAEGYVDALDRRRTPVESAR